MEIYRYNDKIKMKHRSVDINCLGKIKEKVRREILKIRTGEEDEDSNKINAVLKQKKFLNFILHLHEKKVMRRWKE